MPHPISFLILGTISICLCGAISIPDNAIFQSYNEEPGSRNYFLQTSAASFSQKPAQNIDNGNQFPLSQFSQLPQIVNQPSGSFPQYSNRYSVDPQYFDRNAAQTQNAATFSAPNNQNPNSPVVSSQLNHQSPLGVLFSSAPEVSQFHFSGNGVNYSF